jgi:hypothetical protein
MESINTNLQSRSCKSYRYRIEQTPRGALITVNGDGIEEVVADYTRLRVRLNRPCYLSFCYCELKGQIVPEGVFES